MKNIWSVWKDILPVFLCFFRHDWDSRDPCKAVCKRCDCAKYDGAIGEGFILFGYFLLTALLTLVTVTVCGVYAFEFIEGCVAGARQYVKVRMDYFYSELYK